MPAPRAASLAGPAARRTHQSLSAPAAPRAAVRSARACCRRRLAAPQAEGRAYLSHCCPPACGRIVAIRVPPARRQPERASFIGCRRPTGPARHGLFRPRFNSAPARSLRPKRKQPAGPRMARRHNGSLIRPAAGSARKWTKTARYGPGPGRPGTTLPLSVRPYWPGLGPARLLGPAQALRLAQGGPAGPPSRPDLPRPDLLGLPGSAPCPAGYIDKA